MRRRVAAIALAGVALAAAGCLTAHDVITDRPWALVEIAGAPPVDPEGIVGMAFGTDGRYQVGTGCNSGGGTYHLEGNRILLDSEVLQPSPCDEAMAAQDRQILAVLEGEPRYEIDTRTGRLRLTGPGGDVLLFEAP